jgi:ribosomal protein S18 acetylase RimI-like enzyme
MVEIKEAGKDDHMKLANILIPAFSDKAVAILGEEKKALAIIPMILDVLKGLKLMAIENEKPAGAILVSVEEIELPPKTFKVLRSEVGFFGALRAARIVDNYKKSLPRRLDKEARLEAVGVEEKARNRGIGTQLITKAEKWIENQGMEHFGLSVKTSNPAVALYERLGFSITESFENKIGKWHYMRKHVGEHYYIIICE